MKESGRLLILTYHYIREKGGIYPGIHPVSSKSLDRDIKRLLKHLSAATISDVENFVLKSYPLEKDSFFISFDDGLIDHYDAANDVLIANKLSAAFFVSTLPLIEKRSPSVHKVHWLRANMHPEQFLDKLQSFLPADWAKTKLSESDALKASQMHIHDTKEVQAIKFSLNFLIPHEIVDNALTKLMEYQGICEADFVNYNFMSESQILELQEAGHVIGLHGHTHRPLQSFVWKEALEDVYICKKSLDYSLNRKLSWLSYPYGRPDALPENTSEFCDKLDVDLGFTLISGFNEIGCKKSMLKRITPNEIDILLDCMGYDV